MTRVYKVIKDRYATNESEYSNNLSKLTQNYLLFCVQVGGEISSTIMNNMNKYGRVAVCGSISSYNDSKLPKGMCNSVVSYS